MMRTMMLSTSRRNRCDGDNACRRRRCSPRRRDLDGLAFQKAGSDSVKYRPGVNAALSARCSAAPQISSTASEAGTALPGQCGGVNVAQVLGPVRLITASCSVDSASFAS